MSTNLSLCLMSLCGMAFGCGRHTCMIVWRTIFPVFIGKIPSFQSPIALKIAFSMILGSFLSFDAAFDPYDDTACLLSHKRGPAFFEITITQTLCGNDRFRHKVMPAAPLMYIAEISL